MYLEEELLLLSGIQHISFCERQWALIHIEKQWAENIRTVEGQILHENADNPYFTETRGDCIIARAVPLVSYNLGLYGVADVIEFIKTENRDNSIIIPSRKGFWHPNIVEYKRGKPKNIDCDKVQLCAQTMSIEEMFDVHINGGAIYYGEIRHRQTVIFDESLRAETKQLSNLMHQIYNTGKTPKPIFQNSCKMCSLVDICLPKMPKGSVEDYMKNCIDGEY